MSVGFRKSLFGFNCDDVTAYVEKTHRDYSQREIELKEQIEDLKSEINSTKALLASTSAEKAEAEAKLKVFTDKCEDMERLSKNIGKLYLVAKSNAKTVMDEAEKSAEISRREAQKNIASIMSAHRSLSGVKEDIVNTSAKFAKDIDSLGKSLYEARDRIERHEAAVVNSEEDYRELIKVLSNE
ncbi:MAG: hypothetical protein J5659_02780 [Clostridia bacterium]|nr:hypothetical protein [Clostridia bacterium]